MLDKCRLIPYEGIVISKFLEKAESLYLEAFPPEERRPWTDIVKPYSNKGPRLFFITLGCDDRFAGFVTLWQFTQFVYVEHFAVSHSFRGKGIGAEALALLKHENKCPIVLEVEPISDDNPMAERRIAFYQRNGFSLLDYDYTQPPYQVGLPSLPLGLMATSTCFSPEEIESILHKEVYQSE